MTEELPTVVVAKTFHKGHSTADSVLIQLWTLRCGLTGPDPELQAFHCPQQCHTAHGHAMFFNTSRCAMSPCAVVQFFLLGDFSPILSLFRPPQQSPSLRQAGKARAARHPASPPPKRKLLPTKAHEPNVPLSALHRHLSLLLLLGRGQSAAALQSFQSTTQLLKGGRQSSGQESSEQL